MVLINNKKCECEDNKIFMASMPSGYFCYSCGKKIENKQEEEK